MNLFQLLLFRIVCQTGPEDDIKMGPVRVVIGNLYATTAKQYFTYVVSDILDQSSTVKNNK